MGIENHWIVFLYLRGEVVVGEGGSGGEKAGEGGGRGGGMGEGGLRVY